MCIWSTSILCIWSMWILFIYTTSKDCTPYKTKVRHDDVIIPCGSWNAITRIRTILVVLVNCMFVNTTEPVTHCFLLGNTRIRGCPAMRAQLLLSFYSSAFSTAATWHMCLVSARAAGSLPSTCTTCPTCPSIGVGSLGSLAGHTLTRGEMVMCCAALPR